MKFLHLPRLTVPTDLPQRIAQQQPHPLALCPSCRYVLCSCGACHSEECRQPCRYEDGASAEPDGDGKVWCAECGGMFLPHDHS